MGEFYDCFSMLCAQVEPDARDIMPNVASRVKTRAQVTR